MLTLLPFITGITIFFCAIPAFCLGMVVAISEETCDRIHGGMLNIMVNTVGVQFSKILSASWAEYIAIEEIELGYAGVVVIVNMWS